MVTLVDLTSLSISLPFFLLFFFFFFETETTDLCHFLIFRKTLSQKGIEKQETWHMGSYKSKFYSKKAQPPYGTEFLPKQSDQTI